MLKNVTPTSAMQTPRQNYFFENFLVVRFLHGRSGMQTLRQKKLYTMYENSKTVTSPNRN